MYTRKNNPQPKKKKKDIEDEKERERLWEELDVVRDLTVKSQIDTLNKYKNNIREFKMLNMSNIYDSRM